MINLFSEEAVGVVSVLMSDSKSGPFRLVSRFSGSNASGTLLVPEGYWVRLDGADADKLVQTLWLCGT